LSALRTVEATAVALQKRPTIARMPKVPRRRIASWTLRSTNSAVAGGAIRASVSTMARRTTASSPISPAAATTPSSSGKMEKSAE